MFALQSIGECKSKAEEDRIISAELEVLKQRFSDPKLDKSRGREYMVRLLYCEMLGHDASFAYVKALQFASEPNILTKKVRMEAMRRSLTDHVTVEVSGKGGATPRVALRAQVLIHGAGGPCMHSCERG